MSDDKPLRDHLLHLLTAEGAHPDFDSAVKGLPENLRGIRAEGFPHSAWELVEHLRIAQWDLIEYALNPDHVSPDWPDGYWPKEQMPKSNDAWNESVQAFHADLNKLVQVVGDQSTDLLAPIPFTKNATILRQTL